MGDLLIKITLLSEEIIMTFNHSNIKTAHANSFSYRFYNWGFYSWNAGKFAYDYYVGNKNS